MLIFSKLCNPAKVYNVLHTVKIFLPKNKLKLILTGY